MAPNDALRNAFDDETPEMVSGSFVIAVVTSLIVIEYEGGVTEMEERLLEVWHNTDLTHPEQR